MYFGVFPIFFSSSENENETFPKTKTIPNKKIIIDAIVFIILWI